MQQGAQLIYDVWDPKLGNGRNAHTILPNTTSTDIFCGAESLIGEGLAVPTSLTSNMLITGGDATVNGMRNFSNNNVNVFTPGNNTLTASGTMNFARWYPSITTLRNGDKLVLGGTALARAWDWRADARSLPSGIRPGERCQEFQLATHPEWYYPRGFVGFDGAVILLEHSGQIFRLTTDGAGTMQDTGSRTAPGAVTYPSVMFAPFKVLTVRHGKRAQVVDISSSPPVVTDVANLNYDRNWGNATLLPDGEVLVTGGSGVDNQLTNVAYQAEIFNPVYSGNLDARRSPAACATIPRLYHSSALLLPDGSVLTGGGGAPGPINELNAEIYYPPYLYLKDGSGNPAPRPTIVSAPSTAIFGPEFLDDCGKQRSDRHGQPRSSGVQHPCIQSGAAANPCAVLSERNNGHWERWIPLRKKFRQAIICSLYSTHMACRQWRQSSPSPKPSCKSCRKLKRRAFRARLAAFEGVSGEYYCRASLGGR